MSAFAPQMPRFAEREASLGRLGEFQALQSTRRSAEGLVVETELSQHAQIQIAQRHGARIDCQMLAVLKAATGKQDGQIFIAVTIAAAKI